jgi:hypothetical protein
VRERRESEREREREREDLLNVGRESGLDLKRVV